MEEILNKINNILTINNHIVAINEYINLKSTKHDMIGGDRNLNNNKMFEQYETVKQNIKNGNIKSTCNDIFNTDILGEILSPGKSGNYLIQRKFNNFKYLLKIYKYRKTYEIDPPYDFPNPLNKKYKGNHPSDIELLIYQKVASPLIINKNTQNIMISLIKPVRCTFDDIKKSKLCCKMFNIPKIENAICNYDNSFYNLFSFILTEFGSVDAKTFYQDCNEECQIAIIFEILYTLYVMYDFIKFQHFDFHKYNWRGVDDLNYDKNVRKYYIYNFQNTKYYLPVMPYIPKIIDFDRSVIEGINNPMVDAVKNNGRYQGEDRDDPNRFLRSMYEYSCPNIQKWIDKQYNNTLLKPKDGVIKNKFLYGKAIHWPNAEKLLRTTLFNKLKTSSNGIIIDEFSDKNYPNK